MPTPVTLALAELTSPLPGADGTVESAPSPLQGRARRRGLEERGRRPRHSAH